MAVFLFALDSMKRKCFIINYSCLPFGGSAAGGAVALTVPLAFGVPGSFGVVSMAVPLASPWCCAFGGIPACALVLL